MIPGSADRIAPSVPKVHKNVGKIERAEFPIASPGPETRPNSPTASVGAQDDQIPVGSAEMTPTGGESA